MAEEPGHHPGRAVVRAVVAVAAGAGLAGFALSTALKPHSSGPSPRPSPARTFPPNLLPPTAVPAQPLSGFGFSAADDPATHRVVVFGGVESYDTTWLWDGIHWTLAHPLASPPGRFGAAAAYDPQTREVMLYGGRLAAGDVVNDTWAWDGQNWRQLDGGTGNPPPGEGALMAWDEARAEMVLVGSEAWIWTGARWSRQISGALPATSFGTAMAFDPVSHRLILIVACCPPSNSLTSTTWRWDGSRWHLIPTRAALSLVAGMALDPATGRLTLMEWTDPRSPPTQVLTWSGQDWALQAPVQLPIQPEVEVADLDQGQLLIIGSVLPGGIELSSTDPRLVVDWRRLAPTWLTPR